MFELADDKQIGAYLKCAIDQSGYRSVRQFGKACLEERNMPTDDEELRKMANRLSQILKGKKGVQLTDLPVFSRLLDLSCEEILSAGTCVAVSSGHLTNYSIAMSKDQREWEAYLQREDQLILNADEYGKTVIDYALKFQNYDFLKYLMEHKFIWFVGTDKSVLFPCHFGAGTSIESNRLLGNNLNVLDSRMKCRQELRTKMITLAIRQGDVRMLKELRAREIPSLYMADCALTSSPEWEKFYDPELIDALTEANDKILEYFSTEFEIADRFGKTYPFLFPYINRLIPALLKKKNDYVPWMLKDAIRHNQHVLDRLTSMFEASVAFCREYFRAFDDAEWVEAETEKWIMRYVVFHDEGDILCYRSADGRDGIVSNLVKVEATSEDVQTRRLIQEVNGLYDQIRNIRPNLSGGYAHAKTDL